MKNKRINLLLIEDNPGDVHLVCEMLSEVMRSSSVKLNAEILSVDSLSRGLECISNSRIDLILLDLGLPDCQGFETFTRVYNRAQDIPIVVMTGLKNEMLGVKAVQEGAQDYIVKGELNSSLLLRSIRYALERHRLRRELRAMSLTDELTGLLNRRGFLFLAQQQMKIAERSKREMLLLFADLDNIKWINDTFGHHEGDSVLIETAKILKKTFRYSDIIARIGGDEFVALAGLIRKDNPVSITNRLQKIIEEHNKKIKRSYKLSISVGIANSDPRYPCSIAKLITRADRSMYKLKHKKKNSKLKGMKT